MATSRTPPPTVDLLTLQGTWDVVALETDGMPMSAAFMGESRIVVKGTTFRTIAMGASHRGTIAVGRQGKRRSFDLTFTSGPNKGHTQPGIYTIDGDTWTLCLAMTGARPTSFSTSRDSGRALETLKRAADEPKARRTAKASTPSLKRPAVRLVPPPDDRSRETSLSNATEIEGEWAMVRMVESGKSVDAAMVAYCRRVNAGDRTTVYAADRVMMDARFTIDTTTSPKCIDYLATARKPSQAGIYRLEDDRLTINVAKAGAPRPTNFESRRGDGATLTEWRRGGGPRKAEGRSRTSERARN